MNKWILTTLLVCMAFFSAHAQEEIKPEPKGLIAGDIAPDFKLDDYLGNEVHLKSLLEKGPVVLMFYRGYWCPYCNKQLQQFQDSLYLINELGGTVVAITPEAVESINKTVEKTSVQFRIIHDKELAVMKAYDVAFEAEDDLLSRYKKKGIDLNEINADNGANLPVPATYIISQEGKIIYAFFDPNYKKRATVAKILRNL